MNQWKRRSSMSLSLEDPMWQPKYYCFNVYSESELREKLHCMHYNPVKAGLVQHPQDWVYSSARWYPLGKSVGVTISYPI
jgi:hypothetical protein